jgi:hypothetical protein
MNQFFYSMLLCVGGSVQALPLGAVNLHQGSHVPGLAAHQGKVSLF